MSTPRAPKSRMASRAATAPTTATAARPVTTSRPAATRPGESPATWPPAERRIFAAESTLEATAALAEAGRCLQCFAPPCQAHCPAGIPVARFIRMIRSGNLQGAAEAVRAANPLVASCGVACPSDHYCAAACTRTQMDGPVRIRELHLYATRQGEGRRPRPLGHAPRTGQRVAVVGGGPAGLACALELRRHGIDVVLHEARSTVGGVLAHAIPLYRFPSGTIASDRRWIVEQAIIPPASSARAGAAAAPSDSIPAAADPAGTLEILCNHPVEDPTALADAFDAVYLAPGAVPHQPRLAGSELRGVTSAITFLEHCRRRRYRQRVGSRVVVIGGGNVAVDAAMAAVRCGLEGGAGGDTRPTVHLIYRRSRRDMPAWEREVREAEQVGVRLHELVAPLAIIGRAGRVTALRVESMRPGALDASGRPAPEPVPGTAHDLACDQVILATGLELDASLRQLPLAGGGWIRAHPRTRRVRGRIYAGGDATGSDQAIVTAVRDGKAAAAAIVAELGRKR